MNQGLEFKEFKVVVTLSYPILQLKVTDDNVKKENDGKRKTLVHVSYQGETRNFYL